MNRKWLQIRTPSISGTNGNSISTQPSKVLLASLVSAVIPLAATMFLHLQPCFAEDGSPFVVDGETGARREQALPKLSTAKDYYMRGCKESEAKAYAAAVEDFTEALRLNPKYGEAYGNRGAAKFNLGDFHGAISDYDVSLKMFPDNKALLGLKAQAEQSLHQQSNPGNQNAVAQDELRRRQMMLQQAILGGEYADPSTMIMQNAQRRGLVPNVGDPSDPATIIMENARRRGLIPNQ